MSALAAFSDRFKGQTFSILNLLRVRLLGANNEKLDFLMDSFYKLSPPQRTGVLAGFSALVAVFVLAAIGLYFTQVGSLKQDLSNSFAALHELQSLRAQFDQETKNYDKLIDTIDKKTKGQALKPFFEKIAQDLGVTIEGLSDQKVPLPAENPLTEKVQEVRVEMRYPNISIPRLLNYLVEVEKANKYLRVQNLKIRGRYGTRMFFDVEAKIRGYGVAN